MLRSMTAYGRGILETPYGHFVLELQSVNRKFLDINISLPRELLFLEPEIRRWIIAAHVTRGQVNLKLTASYHDTIPLKVIPNLPLAKQLYEAYSQIALASGLNKSDIDLAVLARNEGLLLYESVPESENAYKDYVAQVFQQALDQFQQMKAYEGKSLTEDISERLEKLHVWVSEIETNSQNSVGKFREKLTQRIEEYLPGNIENEEKILREICVYAEKVDIAEEITRFHSHLNRFKNILYSSDPAIGKTLEFILQELGREVNTMGSKSSDVAIAHRIVDLKTEIEKIREQIQNVE
jgi:uncharacterized protein (TIGR00255 family)